MTELNGSGNEKNTLPDFEAHPAQLPAQNINAEEQSAPAAETPVSPAEEAPVLNEKTSAEEAPVLNEKTPAEEAPAPVKKPAAHKPVKTASAPGKRPVRPASGAKRPEGVAPTDRPPVKKRPPAPGAVGTAPAADGAAPAPQKKSAPGTGSAPVKKKPAPAKKKPMNGEDDDAFFARKTKNPIKSFFLFIGHCLVTVLSTVLVLVVAVLAAIIIVCRGPSTEARRLFVCSTNETSALKAVPRFFLSDDVVDAILHPEVEEQAADDFVELNTEVEAIAKAEQGEQELVVVDAEAAQKELEIVDIKGSTFKGKMIIAHDPHKVLLASLDQFGEYGIYLTQFIEKYGAIAGTNAGGFYDPGGFGNGGTPDGLVIRDGKIAYGSPYNKYVDVIGFDSDRVLHCGDMTAQEALDMGIVEAISFSAGPVLIQEGTKRTGLGGGLNPRTCIGQRSDGAVLLLVVEGRHPDSLGATYDDLANLMESYGAVNAGNLDGGSSSAMIYNGEQITKGSTMIGSRPVPTAILVLP